MSYQKPFPGPIGQNGYQQLSSSCSETDLLRLDTGNLLKMVSIVNVPTVGPTLDFMLTYNAQETDTVTNTTLGHYSWRHNYQMSLAISGSLVVYNDESGRAHDFVPDGAGGWKLSLYKDGGNTHFSDMVLSPDGAGWKITFYPSLEVYRFSSTGLLNSVEDAHANALTMAYSSGKLASITEPTGRAITLAYSSVTPYDGTYLTSVTDPNGNVTTLSYDTSTRNLTQIAGPEGCTLSYAYQASSTLITKRTDALTYFYEYAYDASKRLTSVKDAESPQNTVTYSYTLNDTTDKEMLGDSEDPSTSLFTLTTLGFKQTKITDARGKLWTVRFDKSGSIWRVFDPLDHWVQAYSDSRQNGVWRSEGYPMRAGAGNWPSPRTNPWNRLTRSITDFYGNLIDHADSLGVVTHREYDASRRLLSHYHGQAHNGIQGRFDEEFGADGYVLCGFKLSPAGDYSKLPSYVSSIDRTTLSPAPSLSNTANVLNNTIDPRALSAVMGDVVANLPTGRQVQASRWQSPTNGSAFKFKINFSSTASFNLSFYTHSADNGTPGSEPYAMADLFGRDLEIQVDDFDGTSSRTQKYRVYNNAPGVWVTFQVRGDSSHPITVTLTPKGNSSGAQATLAAFTFDPLASRKTSFAYNSFGDMTSITDRLGNVTQSTYTTEGLLSTVTDALSHTTSYFYEDANKNLTRIVDHAGGTTVLSYDANGNVLKAVDPSGKVLSMKYDGKNRLLETVDGLGNRSSQTYNARGEMDTSTDPAGRVTTYLYTPSGRLKEVRDPLNGATHPTKFEYNASGALTKVTDPRNNATQYTFDDAGQLTDVLQPDSQTTSLGYDVFGRVVAVNPPNATQTNTANINLTGAKNQVRNGDLALANPAVTTSPWYWDLYTPTGGTYDTTTGHSGSTSLRWGVNTSYLYGGSQKQMDLPPGVQALARAWAQKNMDILSGSAQLNLLCNDVKGVSTTQADAGAVATLPASTAAWTQLPWAKFKVPSDSQFSRFSAELRPTIKLNAGSSQGRVDDCELYLLGVAYRYNANDQLVQVRTPDGGSTQLIRDRFGRVISTCDQLGRRTAMSYDTMDRVVAIIDPLGNKIQYQWDSVGRLAQFTDARGKTTQYTYDTVDRVTQITYPDNTTELFSYNPNGQLATYTDNMSRLRSFLYDAAGRLIETRYSNGDTVVVTLDALGNVVTRKERNGDRLIYQYDLLDRLVDVVRVPAGANTTPAYNLLSTFDENGNRTALKGEAPASPSVYGTALYGTGTYASPATTWSIPAGGYDSMNRMTKFWDKSSRETSFSFDVEGRRTQTTHPLPAVNPVQTSASYDLMGRLLQLQTLQGANTLMTLLYGYDQASQRIGLTSTVGLSSDTFDYGFDASGRLIEATVNRFVKRTQSQFREGLVDLCLLVGDNVKLLDFPDTFAGTEIQTDRWSLKYSDSYPTNNASVPYVGVEVRQADGLHFAYPRGYSDVMQNPLTVPVKDIFGVKSDIWAAAEHRQKLSGDFDIQVDFNDFQGQSQTDVLIGLRVAVNKLSTDAQDIETGTRAMIYRETNPARYHAKSWGTSGVGSPIDITSVATTDTSGKFRIQRVGSVLKLYYWDNTTSSWSSAYGTDNNFGTPDVWVSLFTRASRGIIAARFRNFQTVSGASAPTAYPSSSGTYESQVYDAGRSVTWDKISWSESIPSGATLGFQVALSSSVNGPWTYQGPTGSTTNKFTTASGSSITDNLGAQRTGRYARFKAFMTPGTGGTATPSFTKVQVSHNGANTSMLQVFAYDGASNMTSKTTETASGIGTDDRTSFVVGNLTNGSSTVSSVSTADLALLGVGETLSHAAFPVGTTVVSKSTSSFVASANATATATGATIGFENRLNQIMRQVVTPAGGSATTWRYAFNLNGCMTSKTDGTNTWTYTFDDDNRMTRVQGPGGVDVTYLYDMQGRMLTRTSGGVTTKFTWDGWNCIREDDGTNVIRYYCPQGELFSIERNSTFYQVHTDALGSVRALTDSTGAIAASYTYGPWGETLAASHPSGWTLSFLFVGGLGVRFDSTTGLHYMRNRWYDAGLTRFLSRDFVKTINPYEYAESNPLDNFDPMGLDTVRVWVEPQTDSNPIGHAWIEVSDESGHSQSWGFFAGDQVVSPDFVANANSPTALLAKKYKISSLKGNTLRRYLNNVDQQDEINGSGWTFRNNCVAFSGSILNQSLNTRIEQKGKNPHDDFFKLESMDLSAVWLPNDLYRTLNPQGALKHNVKSGDTYTNKAIRQFLP